MIEMNRARFTTPRMLDAAIGAGEVGTSSTSGNVRKHHLTSLTVLHRSARRLT
jgi:hypothetical protein